MYKNIAKQKVLHMAEQVDYQDGQIVSRTLVQNSKLSMTLFAFEKDEEISTHAAGGDAMVTVLEGASRKKCVFHQTVSKIALSKTHVRFFLPE